MVRFYILPANVIVRGDSIYRGPKYFVGRFNPDGLDISHSMQDYGLIPAMVVAAEVTQAQHEMLVAELDVVAAPEDIDQNISEIALPKVVSVMEALRIPAGWVDSTYTYRAILRMITGLFKVAQRHHGMHNEALIDSPAQLDLRWNQIPLARRQRIMATADSFGYSYSEVTNQWPIRRILKHLGDQWADRPFKFGNITTL